MKKIIFTIFAFMAIVGLSLFTGVSEVEAQEERVVVDNAPSISISLNPNNLVVVWQMPDDGHWALKAQVTVRMPDGQHVNILDVNRLSVDGPSLRREFSGCYRWVQVHGTNDHPTQSCGGGNPHETVTFCHMEGTPAEHTMTLPRPGFEGHQNHGDTEGPCPTNGENPENPEIPGTTPVPQGFTPSGNPIPELRQDCIALEGLGLSGQTIVAVGVQADGTPWDGQEIVLEVQDGGVKIPFHLRGNGLIRVAGRIIDTVTCEGIGAQVSETVQGYDWTCQSIEHVQFLNVQTQEQGSDFVHSNIVGENGFPTQPTNITDQLEVPFNGNIEIAESYYDPVNCKNAVSVRSSIGGNYQIALTPAYGDSDWYHIVTDGTKDARLIGWSDDDWFIYLTLDGQLHRMNQWGRQLEPFEIELQPGAVLHPNDEDIFFVDENGINRFNVETGEIHLVVPGRSGLEVLGFNANGSIMNYSRSGIYFPMDLTSESRTFGGFAVTDIVFDEDASDHGVVSISGIDHEVENTSDVSELATFTAAEFGASSATIEVTEVVAFDWSDPLKRVTPFYFND